MGSRQGAGVRAPCWWAGIGVVGRHTLQNLQDNCMAGRRAREACSSGQPEGLLKQCVAATRCLSARPLPGAGLSISFLMGGQCCLPPQN